MRKLAALNEERLVKTPLCETPYHLHNVSTFVSNPLSRQPRVQQNIQLRWFRRSPVYLVEIIQIPVLVRHQRTREAKGDSECRYLIERGYEDHDFFSWDLAHVVAAAAQEEACTMFGCWTSASRKAWSSVRTFFIRVLRSLHRYL